MPIGRSSYPPEEPSANRWWHGTTIYQVYPRSFADSNDDGIGDLRGIIDRLDHLVDLGVETVWVSPFFSGPGRDVGYDITDYRDVAPEYGTIADAETLIDEAHRRGLKVLFDLVLNHTSDEHPWFVESRSSRTNPRADWYIWRDGRGPRGKRPPNNWRSMLETRTAWQWDESRQQWYLATFLPFQPDLNWRHPEVRAEMLGAQRFWLDRGVDGFRLDIFGSIMKDPDFAPNPFRPHIGGGAIAELWRRDHTQNTPDNVELARALREVCDEYQPERILLGEVFGPASVLRSYLGDDDGLQAVFLFDFLTFRYDAEWVRERIAEFEREFPAPVQPCYVVENHDRSRSIDRLGGDLAKARVLAMMLCTLRGTITLYQGQEIGMENTPIPLADAMDPIPAEFFPWLPESVARRLPERVNRDEVRTPMQWDSSAHAGFCPDHVEPWLPIPPSSRERNVAAQTEQSGSLLALYRNLLRVRRAMPALRDGSLELVDGLPPGVVAYRRRAEDDANVTVLLNLGREAVAVDLADHGLVLATDERVTYRGDQLRLIADSGAILAPSA